MLSTIVISYGKRSSPKSGYAALIEFFFFFFSTGSHFLRQVDACAPEVEEQTRFSACVWLSRLGALGRGVPSS
jgi:hypothetical protein